MFKHLKEANETYIQHFIKAIKFSFLTFTASLIFLIHAICPALFERTGSNLLTQILARIKRR